MGECDAPHNLCATTGLSNSKLTASVMFHTVLEGSFLPPDSYLFRSQSFDKLNGILLHYCSYYERTITSKKCVFISTCTHDVSVTVLLLMLWYPGKCSFILVHFGAIELALNNDPHMLLTLS